MQRQSTDMGLLVLYPTEFTNKESFILGLVVTVTLKLCCFQNTGDCSGFSMPNHPEKNLQTTTVLWQSSETGSIQETKQVSDSKNVWFESKKC